MERINREVDRMDKVDLDVFANELEEKFGEFTVETEPGENCFPPALTVRAKLYPKKGLTFVPQDTMKKIQESDWTLHGINLNPEAPHIVLRRRFIVREEVR